MKSYRDRLRSQGLKVIGKKRVHLKDLHIRYVPLIANKYWRGERPMLLSRSPHVELMEIFLHHGFDEPLILSSRYFRDRQFRHRAGLNWPDYKIWTHIQKRYRYFKIIKKNGFDEDACKDTPLTVLREPFWKTRYNHRIPFLYGFEIWNGAGRAAAAYALSIHKLPCVLIKDVKPGIGRSHLDKKLKGVVYDRPEDSCET